MGCFARAPVSPAAGLEGGPIGRFVSNRQPRDPAHGETQVVWLARISHRLTGGYPTALVVVHNNIARTFRVLLYDPPSLRFAENDKGCPAVTESGRFSARSRGGLAVRTRSRTHMTTSNSSSLSAA